jgi:hypothetical protein
MDIVEVLALLLMLSTMELGQVSNEYYRVFCANRLRHCRTTQQSFLQKLK